VATDDELYEIGATAWVGADHSGEEPFSTERRALYEAGDKNGYQRGSMDADRLWLNAVAWLLTDEAVMEVGGQIINDWRTSEILKALHDRIAEGHE
jgi:hypothetical protein